MGKWKKKFIEKHGRKPTDEEKREHKERKAEKRENRSDDDTDIYCASMYATCCSCN